MNSQNPLKGIMERKSKDHKNCPLAPVDTRLENSHNLWHDSANNYGDPTRFNMYINSCIQELRNVTFILQKNKRIIPDFDEWYDEWKKRMREDPVANWLVHSRNRIVKEGDLDTFSLARVYLIFSYLEKPFQEIEVDPFTPNSEIAANVNASIMPPALQNQSYLQIERKWVSSDLTEYELLDALARMYGLLSILIHDAHQKIDREILTQETFPNGERRHIKNSIYNDGRLPCMFDTTTFRSEWFTINGRRPVNFVESPQISTFGEQDYAAEKYGLNTAKEKLHSLNPDSPLEDVLWVYFEVAKRILKKDRHHVLTASLFDRNGPVSVINLAPEHQGDKFVMWERVARQVTKCSATKVVVVGEIWLSKIENISDVVSYYSKSKTGREEALMLSGINHQGEEIHITLPFKRGLRRRVKFSRRPIVRRYRANFLEPIRRAWNLRDKQV